ncbi:MAG: DNA-protecting protein DprA, partial [Planctomycetes bacterium]|nr:DNA-protecting protein DprA [Planctomycetota bacterium]
MPENLSQKTADAYLRLALIPGLGPLSVTRLLEHVENIQEVFSMSMDQLQRIDGIGNQRARKICDPRGEEYAAEERARCLQHNIHIMTRDNTSYPQALKNLSDPPIALWIKGSIERRDQLAISIVGPRKPSVSGHRNAQVFASSLSRCGACIISGLARGVDTIAHQSALKAKGRTIAVLGSGFGNLYPEENAALADEIADGNGAVISEFPFDVKPHAGNFPRRNRIVAAFGLATLVIEAGKRSGSLITARLAAELGRDILVLPGSIEREETKGSNQLIRDGATCITSIDDVLEEVAPLNAVHAASTDNEAPHPRIAALNKRERDMYALLSDQSRTVDDLVSISNLPVSAVSTTLMSLELRRL